MVPPPLTEPDEALGRPRAFLLKKGTFREYDILEFHKAVKIYDREQSLFVTQEKALAGVMALKNEFKPSNNARIYEVDARYKEALKTSRIQMDAWFSKYWRAYTEAEELQISAVAGFHGHLDFLKAVNAFPPDFSVTQTAVVEEAMFDDRNDQWVLWGGGKNNPDFDCK
ncbi:hypothetical protein DL770_010739 [Monosporascus sp. CRB-9-2]|nr:hypothetical protein DL770_010739 [Monosporascus sp. CRB-9-2]